MTRKRASRLSGHEGTVESAGKRAEFREITVTEPRRVREDTGNACEDDEVGRYNEVIHQSRTTYTSEQCRKDEKFGDFTAERGERRQGL